VPTVIFRFQEDGRENKFKIFSITAFQLLHKCDSASNWKAGV
jgi:hypothetical protein